VKFALVNGVRREPTSGLKGNCPACGGETISKCGEIVVHHWAHKSRDCDKWSEGETQWHRDWKNCFPSDWQEVVHKDESGNIHRADITNAHNWVIEFQHSYLKTEEIVARNDFYKNIIWIVDAQKPNKGQQQFLKTLESGNNFSRTPRSCLVLKNIASIFKKWSLNKEFVFFDIGEDYPLYLLQKSHHGDFLIEVPREYLIKVVLNEEINLVDDLKIHMDKHIKNLNDVKIAPKRGFLAGTPHFKFNLDGTIKWIEKK